MKRAAKILEYYGTHSDRMILMEFKGKPFDIIILQIYVSVELFFPDLRKR